MNILAGQLVYILLVTSLAGAVSAIAGKRSIFESLVPGINIPPPEFGLSSDIAVQFPSQAIAVHVPHPVPVPVPHPIVVPVERPVPVAIDRPIPYPVPIIKKYFIPVPFKVVKPVPVPVPTPTLQDGSGSDSGSDLDAGSEITAETNHVYTNRVSRTEIDSLASGNNSGTTTAVVSTSPATRAAKRNSSFRIHVKET